MPAQHHLRIETEDVTSPVAAQLIEELSAELAARYGDDGSGGFTASDVQMPGAAFVVAWQHDRPVGCGALRPLSPDVAEIKRMYVATTARRQGIASHILAYLERLADEFGYRAVRLETGLLQPEAIALYQALGYQRIPNFGHYADSPLSISFEKQLG